MQESGHVTSALRHSLDQKLSLHTAEGIENVLFGLVWAIGIEPNRSAPGFDARLSALLETRKDDLTTEEDATRQASRDILRHGRYKPTGRGKPACEYLVRAARQETFPRIFPAVDVCNYISLKYLVPASVWDLDLAGTSYTARRGRVEERYVFNASGQTIDLQDLLLLADGADRPMVNPVKDSQRTKTTASSRNVAAVAYLPLAARIDPETVMNEFESLLAGCGDRVETGILWSGGNS
ncbi:MAG: hypothetical protein HKN29_02165 [Rhodothermales bacterium]|nr:hypothetical protein [Rhodothermales bacterium]